MVDWTNQLECTHIYPYGSQAHSFLQVHLPHLQPRYLNTCKQVLKLPVQIGLTSYKQGKAKNFVQRNMFGMQLGITYMYLGKKDECHHFKRKNKLRLMCLWVCCLSSWSLMIFKFHFWTAWWFILKLNLHRKYLWALVSWFCLVWSISETWLIQHETLRSSSLDTVKEIETIVHR